MQLEWLRGQLKFLKKMGIRGFTDLPDDLRLEARPLGGEPNRMLYALGGPQELTIGVGYDSIRDLKDGGLRVSAEAGVDAKGRRRFDVISPGAFLDSSSNWWILDGAEWRTVGLH